MTALHFSGNHRRWLTGPLILAMASVFLSGPATSAGYPRHREDERGRYDMIHGFDSTSATGGGIPYQLAKTSDGRIFGLTLLVSDVPDQVGAIYRLHANGAASIVHLLGNRDSALIGARSGGSLYFTVMLDDYVYEPRGCGELQRLNPSGSTDVLFRFSHDSPLGCYLRPHLIEDADGSLIGATRFEAAGGGAFYRVTPDGSATVLHTVTADAFHGPHTEYPVSIAPDGSLYALSHVGIFRLEPDATATLVTLFDQATIGYIPPAGMIVGPDGALYGTTLLGGLLDGGAVFRFDPAAGTATLLHAFDRNSKVHVPDSALVLATDGYLYGTASGGAYRLKTDGSGYEELVRFQFAIDGMATGAPMIQTTTGDILGVRGNGLIYGSGMIYRLRAHPAR